MEELLEPHLKDTDLGLPYWDWVKNSTLPQLWENIPSPLKEWNERRFDPIGYQIIPTELMNEYQTVGCQSSSMNYGEVVLRINNTNVLDMYEVRSKKTFEVAINDVMQKETFTGFANDLQVKNDKKNNFRKLSLLDGDKKRPPNKAQGLFPASHLLFLIAGLE